MGTLILIAVFFLSNTHGLQAQTVVALSAPRLAVSPFDYPADPDYGVFIADRLCAELTNRSYSEALDRRRFVLVEPDTIPAALTRLVAAVAVRVPEEALELLRRKTRAD